MPDRVPLQFRPARELRAAAESAYRRERRRILRLVPEAEVLHGGGSSLPDALTAGDVDLHVRVPPALFEQARDALAGSYDVHRREMWTDGLATFVAAGAATPTGIALTALGGEHDRRFLDGWARLAADPELLAEYNALKRRHEGSADVERYEREKGEFFTRLTG